MLPIVFQPTKDFKYESSKTAGQSIYHFFNGHIFHGLKNTLLAKGLRARVKQAREIESGQIFARKICSLETEDQLQAFDNTIALFERLAGHKGIMGSICSAKYYSNGKKKGVIIMPCADFDLNTVITNNFIGCHLKKHPLAIQLLAGLKEIYDLDGGGAHCDVKPENILIKDDVVYITDLEFYHSPAESIPPRGITKGWAPPEIAYKKVIVHKKMMRSFSGKQPPIDTTKLDSWSAGLVLYSIFTNRFQDSFECSWERMNTSDSLGQQAKIDRCLMDDYQNGSLLEEEFFLLSHMLKVDPQQRWTIVEAHDYFLKVGTENRDQKLYEATQSGDLKKVTGVLARVEISNECRSLSIYHAVEFNHRDIFDALLADSGISIEGQKKIYDAARLKNLGRVKQLVYALFSHNTLSVENRGIAVIQAAHRHDLDIVQILLTKGSISMRDLEILLGLIRGNLTLFDAIFPYVQGQFSEHHRFEIMNYAMEDRRLDIVQKMLIDGISEENRGKVVVKASRSGFLDICKIVLQQGDISIEHRGLAIQQAAGFGHVDIVQILLNNGNISEEHRGLAVRYAASSGHLEIVEILIKNGSISDNDILLSIRYAAESFHTNIVSVLTENDRISEEHRGIAIGYAALAYHSPSVTTLLARGDISREHRGIAVRRAVHACVWNRALNLDILQTLLTNGEISDQDRVEAVYEASLSGHVNVIQLLLAHGQISQEHRGIAVVHAAKAGSLESVQTLLINGQISEKHRGQAVVYAGRIAALEIIKELLDNGLIPQEHRGNAVTFAARKSDSKMIQLLLRDGKISIEDRGFAVQRATRVGCTKGVQVLLENGDILLSDRRTALNSAEVGGYLDIVQILIPQPRNEATAVSAGQLTLALADIEEGLDTLDIVLPE